MADLHANIFSLLPPCLHWRILRLTIQSFMRTTRICVQTMSIPMPCGWLPFKHSSAVPGLPSTNGSLSGTWTWVLWGTQNSKSSYIKPDNQNVCAGATDLLSNARFIAHAGCTYFLETSPDFEPHICAFNISHSKRWPGGHDTKLCFSVRNELYGLTLSNHFCSSID